MTTHITFVHGIGNKPTADDLISSWRTALAANAGILSGPNTAISSSMVYWADVLYEAPSSRALAAADDLPAGARAAAADMAIEAQADLSVVADSEAEQIWLDTFEAKLNISAAASHSSGIDGPDQDPNPNADAQIQRIPIPWFLKKMFMKRFLRDVHHYLFNSQYSPRPGQTYRVQDEVRQRFIATLAAAPAVDRHIVVAHSLGSVIAYDCLKRVPSCPPIDGLITVGSPLGIDEVQDKLAPQWSRDNGFPFEKLRRLDQWANVFDPLDLVATLDPYIANDFKNAGVAKAMDVVVSNNGEWGHAIDVYLRTDRLRSKLKAML